MLDDLLSLTSIKHHDEAMKHTPVGINLKEIKHKIETDGYLTELEAVKDCKKVLYAYSKLGEKTLGKRAK